MVSQSSCSTADSSSGVAGGGGGGGDIYNNNVYLLSAVPQSQTGLTALYNEIKAGHNNELSKIKMNLK